MKKCKIKIIAICLIFIFLPYYLISLPVLVKNSLKEIDSCEGKILLNLVKVWGDDDTDNLNQIFRMPTDIKVYKDYVYIIDSGNNRIQIFTLIGKFVKTIGRKGQGPGDLSYPKSLVIDNQNNLIVADYSNDRIQILDSSGKYLSSFKTKNGMPLYVNLTAKDEIAVYSYSIKFKTKLFLTLYDYKGQILEKIGKHLDSSTIIDNNEYVSISLDKNSDVFFAYGTTPFIQKITKRGEVLLSVVFEVPFKTSMVEVEESSKNLIIKGDKKDTISSAISISVDDKSNIYLVTATRSMNENEIVYMVGNKSSIHIVAKSNKMPNNTDMFRLLVFNEKGKVFAAKKLNIYSDSIYVFKDHLFIIDSYRGMKIYEYKFSFI